MKTSLAEIVIQNIEFLNLASDSDIHPDVAVQQLESIASLIKELPPAELNCFLEEAAKRLEELRSKGASEERIALLENLRENLGI